jgi:ubiquinone/menaquinone biosynthesis C-methylase UbiE
MDESPIIDYYRRRAADSQGTYGPPEIQPDFARAVDWVRTNASNRNVLEVACGIGHWTNVAAGAARRIVASDVSWDVVAEARRRTTSAVDFMVADARELPIASATFDCGMAHFWLSHVPRPEVTPFMNSFCRAFAPGSCLLFIDSKWVDGYRHSIVRQDAEGNTYHVRRLKDGSRYEILKNYLTRSEWINYMAPFGTVHVEELSYIWLVCVRNSACT